VGNQRRVTFSEAEAWDLAPPTDVRPSSSRFYLALVETKMQNNHTLAYTNTSSWWRRAKLLVGRVNRGFVFGVIMFAALLAFELFNYTTTDFALSDF
jgi:hypothetical protein